MANAASRITRVELDSDRTITTGTIRVDNIVVSNPLAVAIEVVFCDTDNTAILNIVVGPYDTKFFEGIWVADNGLLIRGLSDSNVVVTILHTSVGA